MKIIDVIQGTDEWHQHRGTAEFSASEAPIVMGVSPYVKRDELLHMKATGDEREFSEWFQKNILDKGHRIEALARDYAEEFIDDDLFPVTGVTDDGRFLASFDGITMANDLPWECKQYNQQKVEDVQAGRCPECDYWQVVHQIMVSDAPRALYTVSDGTRENTFHVYVERNNDDINKLLAAYEQFQHDLASFTPKEKTPEPVGRVMENLPAPRLIVQGAVVDSNLGEFKAMALDAIGRINTDLQTDQDFADAEQAVKWCKNVEERIDQAKEYALSQTTTISEALNTLDQIREEARQLRLQLNREVEDQKKQRRQRIRQDALDAIDRHHKALSEELGYRLPDVEADIAGAMKGKRKLDSMQASVNDEVARVKIELNQLAEHMGANLERFNEAFGSDKRALFPDLGDLLTRESDGFMALCKERITSLQVKQDAEDEGQLTLDESQIPENDNPLPDTAHAGGYATDDVDPWQFVHHWLDRNKVSKKERESLIHIIDQHFLPREARRKAA